LQRRVREVEKENGVILSDTRVLWCGKEICEERAADGSTVTRREFDFGEQSGGVPQFLVADHLHSVTEVTDSAGVILARYAFDPWGRRTIVAGVDATSVGFTGHRQHQASGLLLSLYRAYDPSFARWASEDLLVRHASILSTIDFQRRSGFAYADDNPTTYDDPLGLQVTGAIVAVCGGNPAAAAVAAIATVVVACKPCRQQLMRKWECDEQFAADVERCKAFTNKRLKNLCFANAMDRLGDCNSGRPPRPAYPTN
jgi:RHS repeat-associated protein